ncbi:uncharacterized protein LOC121864309 [Homarus americanus]|uniref:uncharacterized protein LOC121864309 n=1 Tax=Homarus americanus TaxID=6706 RepID=UPI001C494D9D|nr:uncharacterized protein LOC121864309 [Homarus americanus]
MKLQILVSIFAVARAGRLQSYSLPTIPEPYNTESPTVDLRQFLRSGKSRLEASTNSSMHYGDAGYEGSPSCGSGQVRHVDGSCVTPQVTRNVVRAERLQSYSLPTTTKPDKTKSHSVDLRQFLRSGNIPLEASTNSSMHYGDAGYEGSPSCGSGQVRHVDGSCVTPQVNRNVYHFRIPLASSIVDPRPVLPPPIIENNIFFIHLPVGLLNRKPIVVPPPQQRNVVYVLNKQPNQEHTVVHAPGPEQPAPEVYFVNYAEGENPTLPRGGKLQSALSIAAERDGEVVNSGVKRTSVFNNEDILYTRSSVHGSPYTL